MLINLFIGAWLSISPLPGQSDTTSVVLVEWWHTADKTITFDIELYSITDSTKDYVIYDIIKIDSIINTSGFIERPVNTYLYGLVTEKIPYKTMMYCTARGYGTEYFYHYGKTDVIKTPGVELRK
jgi:hypothetical protein